MEGLPVIVMVDTEYACFWLEANDRTGVINKVPPIARWTLGKDLVETAEWYQRNKGAKLTWERT